MGIKSIFFSLLKRTKKNNKKMEITEENLAEARIFYEKFDFQWIKGDDSSMMESYKGIIREGDLIFIEFKSGKRINYELLNEYMLTIPAAYVPPVEQVVLQAEPQKLVQQSNSGSSVTSIIYEDAKIVQNDSPIYKLLKKQKKNMVEVSIKIKLNLPPKDLYTVLSSSFDDAEKEIIEFVLDSVDMGNIKGSLADSIKKTYYIDQNKPNKEIPKLAGTKK